jgi:hypothetical protein
MDEKYIICLLVVCVLAVLVVVLSVIVNRRGEELQQYREQQKIPEASRKGNDNTS